MLQLLFYAESAQGNTCTGEAEKWAIIKTVIPSNTVLREIKQ
jgi:hypothetical protein